MNIFYKICVILIIIGGINWGLIGLFSFDAVAWLLGGRRKFALPRGIYRGWYRRAVRHSQPVRQRAAGAPGGITPARFPSLPAVRCAAFTKRVFGRPLSTAAGLRCRFLSFQFLRKPLPGGISSPYRAPRTLQKPHFWYIICYKCAHLRAL